MTPEYLKAQEMIKVAIRDRTISLSGKQAARYEQGDYKPFFSLAEREGRLICIACVNAVKQNPKKPSSPYDKVFFRLTHADVTEGLTIIDKLGKGKSWPEAIRAVIGHFRMRESDS